MIRWNSLILCSLLTMGTNAQFYNWGWGPEIGVTESGSTITCSVWDPNLNTNRTESYSSVASWSYDDGVVATVSASGTVQGIVYDIALANFVEESFSFSSGTSVTNVDGIIAWVTGSGTVGGAIYHPALHQWLDESFSFASGTSIINRDGVVSWVTGSGTVGGAVFDPQTQQWMDESFSFGTGTTLFNRDGVVAWVTGSGTTGAAVYDPSLGQWIDESFSFSSGTTVVLEDGVFAWRTGTGTIGAAAYNWSNGQWVEESFSFSASNTDLAIVDGTVRWNNGGQQRRGFTASNQWQADVNTALRCKYYAEAIDSDVQHLAYLWCLTIGASTYTHLCGDGHQITRRWAWKEYANPGSYAPQFNAFSSTTNTQCNGQLNFVGTAVEENASPAGLVLTVDHEVVRVSSGSLLGAITILDGKGSLVYTGIHNSTSASIVMPAVDGVYALRSANGRVQRFVLVR